MRKSLSILITAMLCTASLTAVAQTGESDNNPPGARGGPGTNWENRPGAQGGPGASPNRVPRRADGRELAQADSGMKKPCRPGAHGQGQGYGRQDQDNNPPGRRGGAGTNWENRPGAQGGPGASPNRQPRIRPENGAGDSVES